MNYYYDEILHFCPPFRELYILLWFNLKEKYNECHRRCLSKMGFKVFLQLLRLNPISCSSNDDLN